MKQIEKRISELEALTPKKNVMNGLGEYYAWEKTAEGQAELAKLYGSEEEHKKMMTDYHNDLRERGLL